MIDIVSIENQINLQKSFTQVADTFILTASLAKEQLLIQLVDINNKIKYLGEYYEGHQQIKSSIQEVYDKLYLPYLSGANSNKYEKHTEQRQYKFGDKILNQKGQQCYQIDQGGKITVFCVALTQTKRKIPCHSFLKLQKETHVLAQHQILLNKKQQQISKLIKENKEITSQSEKKSLIINQFCYIMKSIMDVNNKQYFQVNGNKIRNKKDGKQYNYYAFADTLIFIKDKVQFYLKITNLTNNKIIIGIVDCFDLQNNKFKDIYKKSINISGNGGVFTNKKNSENEDEKLQKFKIKTLDILKVSVNREDTIVEFNINNQVVAAIKNEMLSDAKKIFVPFVSLMNGKNSVEVLTKQNAEFESKKKEKQLKASKEVFEAWKQSQLKQKGEKKKNQVEVVGQQSLMEGENNHKYDQLKQKND